MYPPLSVSCTLIGLLFSCLVSGQTVVTPGRWNPIVKLDRVELLADSAFTMGIPRVFFSDDFRRVETPPLQLPAGAVYWLRFSLRHYQEVSQRTYLRLTASNFYSAQLFLVNNGSSPQSPLKLQQRHAIFPVDVPPGETVTAYLYLDRRYLPVTCELELLTAEGLALREADTGYSAGLYTGAGLLYLLIAVLLTVLVRNRESIYYLLYVGGSMFYLFYIRAEPLPVWLRFHDLGFLYDVLPYASVAVSTVGHLGLFYTYFYLGRKRGLREIVVSIQIGCVIVLTALLCWPLLVDVWFGSYQFLVQSVAFLSVLSLAVILVSSLSLMWGKLQLDQWLFLISFLPMLTLVLYIWFAEAMLLPRLTVIYENAPGLLVFYEGTLLGSMLVYRYLRERLQLLHQLANERREIIHDVHSGLLPEIDALRELNHQAIRPLSGQVHERVSRLSNEVTENLRLLMWSLNRTEGEHLDELVGRLRQKVHIRFENLPVRSVFTTEPAKLSEKIAVPFAVSYHLPYFLKEVINNAAKHARCSEIICNLACRDHHFELTIADDGRGFAYESGTDGAGYGLAELRQRAEKMGGKFSCSTRPGTGTTVHLLVPLRQ